MTRATRFFTLAAAVAALWTLLVLGVLPLPLLSTQAKDEILPAVSHRQSSAPFFTLLMDVTSPRQLPWWVLVSTGSYLLFEIGWGLYTFNDVPKAYDDLMIVSYSCAKRWAHLSVYID